MLIFPSEIEGEAPGFASTAKAAYGIEALLIRTAIVVDDSLTQMEAIVQWGARHTSKTGIDTFQAVARMQKVRKRMDVGPDILTHSEIEFESPLVAWSRAYRSLCLVKHVRNT